MIRYQLMLKVLMLLMGRVSPAAVVHCVAERANSNHRSCRYPLMASANGNSPYRGRAAYTSNPLGGARSVAGRYSGLGIPASRAAMAWSMRASRSSFVATDRA